MFWPYLEEYINIASMATDEHSICWLYGRLLCLRANKKWVKSTCIIVKFCWSESACSVWFYQRVDLSQFGHISIQTFHVIGHWEIPRQITGQIAGYSGQT